MNIMDTLPETTLREVIEHRTFAGEKANFSTENWKAIQFELNHLELHSMDDYLYTMHRKGISSDSNEGNSHVAYLLGLTTVKPDGPLVTVGGSFPDIDLDFEKERREEVRQHLVEKYGKERVAAIGTFQFPKPKGLFKDTARMHDLDFKLSNEISKMIPDRPDLESFEEALNESTELKELYDSNEQIKEIIDYAQKLEGTIRTIGVHACLSGNTKLLTDRGYKNISELSNFGIVTSNGVYSANAFSSGEKEVFKLKYSRSKYSKEKRFIEVTEDHEVNTIENGWTKAKDAVGLTLANGVDSETYDPELVMSGWFWNDGNYVKSEGSGHIYFTPEKDDQAIECFSDLITNLEREDRYRIHPGTVNRISAIFGNGFKSKNHTKGLPVLSTTEETIAWLRGFFSANASVQRGCIRLKITCFELLKFIESKLWEFNISGSFHSVDGKLIDWSNGTYFTRPSNCLELSVNDSFHFNQIIGFIQSYKSERIFNMKYQSIEPVGKQEVYDFTVHTLDSENMHGFTNGVQVHNCGMCISIDPIAETVPLFDSKGTSVTQFDGPTLEKIGLIKYDILGLKNLSTISKTTALVKKTRGEDIDVEQLEFDCPEAFKLIADGNSLGIFQIEGSQGLRDFAAASKPTSINDMAAVISLYRPGPMGMGALDKYLARKTGKENAMFDVPKYHHIFKDTYGLLIYQEQLMILAAEMCGFNDIETDVLRKAVGKKDRDLLLAQKDKFVQGAVANGEDERQISILFDEMEEFARYCFNKSHAICYAKIGCQTAWLKAHYLEEYMAALISTEEDPDQQALYIEDARRNGVQVLPPDLNNSSRDFTVGSNGEILFGFNCIKGVGGAAVGKILDLQPFDSFGDFIIKSHHAKGINKKIIEALINCGACDVFGWKRSCMIANFEHFLSDYKKSATGYAKKNNMPLKENPDGFPEVIKFYMENEDGYFDSSEIPEYPILKILDYEKELLGINVSGNPFSEVGKLVKENFKTISNLTETDQTSYILGQINKVKKITTKKGDPMAFFDLTDENGDSRSFTLFPQAYEKCSEVLKEGTFVLAMTTSKTTDRGKDFIVNAVRDLTLCIDQAEDRAEAKRSMKSIDVHMVGTLGTVRFRSLIKKIEEYTEEKDTGYSITLKCDIGNTVLKLKTWNVSRIDIPMLREFGKLADVYVTRGN